MQKPKWLDRRVAKPGPFLILCLSKDELRKSTRDMTETPLPFPLSGALCSTLDHEKTGEFCAVVSLSQSSQNMQPIEIAGLLVHEAVHVWQEYALRMGESSPGSEQEAYAIQAISQELMAEYARRIN